MNTIRDHFDEMELDIHNKKFEWYGKLRDMATHFAVSPGDKGINPAEIMYMSNFMIRKQGCEMWYFGHKYPMRAYIGSSKVVDLAKVKRMIPMFGRFVGGKVEFKKKNIFSKTVIIFAALWYKEYILEWIGWAWRDLQMPEDRYNQPARELYRTIKDEKIRNIICPIVEYDCAYKYRAQDILAELNKELFFKSPRKEVCRLIDILIKREHDEDIAGSQKSKWQHIKLGINMALIFSRKFKKQLIDFVWDLDIEAIKPNVADKYWMTSPAYDESYDFMGLNSQERKKLHENI